MSALAAREMSGFDRHLKEGNDETDGTATGGGKMVFEEVYRGWQGRRLTQEEAARVLGVCRWTFRRLKNRYVDKHCRLWRE
jgi:hypothetical protein